MNFFFYATLTALIFVAVVLILLILIQKGRGGGLSGAFGGSGGSTAFGTKTGDVLTWATSVIFLLFIILACVLDLIVSHQYPSTPPAVVTASGTTASTTVPPVTPDLPVAPQPTITPQPTPTIPAPTVPTSMPTTLPSISNALNTLGKSMPTATTAPSILDNGLKQVQKDITKVQQGLTPASKP